MRSAPPWLLQSLAVALLWAALAGCTNEQETLVLGYTVGEPNKPVALAISEVLQDNDVKVSLDAPFRSLEELTAAVEGGAVDLAVLGEPLQPNSHLNMLMPVLPRVLHVLHHKSLDEPTLRQLLLARSIFAGQENGMGQTIIKALARHYQIPDLASRLLDSPWVPAPNEPPQVYFIFGGLLSAEALAGFVRTVLTAPVKAVKARGEVAEDDFVPACEVENVKCAVRSLVTTSAWLGKARVAGKVKVVGAVYDLAKGTVGEV